MGAHSSGARHKADDSTLELASGAFRQKDGGTTLAKLASALQTQVSRGVPGFGAGTEAGINSTVYFPLCGGKSAAGESTVATRPPGSGDYIITKLRFQAQSDGGTSTYVLTLMKNGSATALATTRANAAAGGSSVQDNDEVTFTSDGDTLSLRLERTAGAQVIDYPTWTFLIKPVLA